MNFRPPTHTYGIEYFRQVSNAEVFCSYSGFIDGIFSKATEGYSSWTHRQLTSTQHVEDDSK